MTDEKLEQQAAMPQLTLDPLAAEQAPAEAKPEIKPVELDDSTLSDTEKKAVADFADKIDISNSTMILQYGASAQKKLSDFSESALASVRTKDLGEVGDMITDLVGELKGFSVEEDDKGVLGFLGMTDVEFIYAEGLSMGAEAADKAFAEAEATIGTLA